MDATDPIPGQEINGKYRVIGPIARGGMGMVYEARQLALGRRIALKILRREAEHGRRDPAFLERFSREASLSAKISHPNVVTVFDYGPIDEPTIPELEGGYFIAMEFLPGETLRDRIKRVGMLSPADAIHVIGSVARGVREAHRLGLIHRDLKPGNIMLVPHEDGEWIKVLDFGLVKQVDSEEVQELTSEGMFLGSPRFISPEQVLGEPVDVRADVYSLGVIFYQCLCGNVPFSAETTLQTMMARVGSEAPRMSARVPGFSTHPALEDLVMRMIARSPDQRPRDLAEVLRSLRGIQVAMGLTPDALTASNDQSAPHPAAGVHAIGSGASVVAVSPAIEHSQPSLVHSLAGATRSSSTGASSRTRKVVGIVGVAVSLTLVAAVGLTLASHPNTPATHVVPLRSGVAVAPPPVIAAPPPLVIPPPVVRPVVVAPPVVPIVRAPVIVAPQLAPPPVLSTAPVPEVSASHRGSHGHHVSGTEMSSAVAASTVPPTTVSVPSQDGYLSFDTTPWTHVYVDGRDIGATPVQRYQLPVGEHRVTLRNPDLGINTSVNVTIRAGETTARRMGLD